MHHRIKMIVNNILVSFDFFLDEVYVGFIAVPKLLVQSLQFMIELWNLVGLLVSRFHQILYNTLSINKSTFYSAGFFGSALGKFSQTSVLFTSWKTAYGSPFKPSSQILNSFKPLYYQTKLQAKVFKLPYFKFLN